MISTFSFIDVLTNNIEGIQFYSRCVYRSIDAMMKESERESETSAYGEQSIL